VSCRHRLFDPDFQGSAWRACFGRADRACLERVPLVVPALVRRVVDADKTIRATVAAADAIAPGPVALVFYEDLVRDAAGSLRRTFAFLGLPDCPACVAPIAFAPLVAPNLGAVAEALRAAGRPEFLPMLDAAFNRDVDTDRELARIRRDLQRDFSDPVLAEEPVRLGFWRRS